MPPRELTMPKLSDSMADAVILKWLKSTGESFARGDGLIEVETDKATVVYEAEWDGTLEAILAPEGTTVAVGEPIATLLNGDGAASEAAGPPSPRPAVAPSAPQAQVRLPVGARKERAIATPVARRRAVELGISLHDVAGTGPGGRITVDDVTRAVASGTRSEAADSGKGHVEIVTLTPTQATIARRMAASAASIPVFTVSVDVDVSQIIASRREARDSETDAPSVNDFVVKAAAATLREFPRFNASYVDGRVECYSRINVGIAVATDDALLVPVLRDADRRPLAEISAESRRLADAARRRALAPADFHDGTFTVSNLGMLGVTSFTAIVDPPQVAILAVGAARRTPVEDAAGRVTFRDVMSLTLSCDHRVVYGADGARFLSRLRELLERPLTLAL